jgi:hypothetical protein
MHPSQAPNIVALGLASFITTVVVLAAISIIVFKLCRLGHDTPKDTPGINQALKSGDYYLICKSIECTPTYNIKKNMFYIHMFITKTKDKCLARTVVSRLFNKYRANSGDGVLRLSPRFSKSLMSIMV